MIRASASTLISGIERINGRYISKPLLLDGYKFDLRLYVLVSGCDPLRIFLHRPATVLQRRATVYVTRESWSWGQKDSETEQVRNEVRVSSVSAASARTRTVTHVCFRSSSTWPQARACAAGVRAVCRGTPGPRKGLPAVC